jgi:F-type H+-transporting ATPase subunit b
MELDWTTFLLEILNFLILVWLLKRFLYKPVLQAIAQRKAAIEQLLADAQRQRAEAEALRTQYDNRLAEWKRERESAHTRLLEEIDAERGRLMADVQTALQQERDKAAAVEQRRARELARHLEEQALLQGAGFAARFLSRLVGPALEARIIDMVLTDLSSLPDSAQQTLRSALASPETPVRIVSAFPLQEAQRDALGHALEKLAGRALACDFTEDAALGAGLRLSIGAWMLRANLQDELAYFAESAQYAALNHP